MASLIDLVKEHLGPQELSQISQQLGTDQATAQQAVNAALPALVGGLANTAQQPQGASGVQQLIGSHAGVLGQLGSLLGAGAPADGGGVLGRVLGQHQPEVQQGVQQASGLGSDQTRKLLMILAPIVLAAIMKSRQNRTADGAVASGGGLGIPGMGGGLGIPGMGGAARPADASTVDSDGDGIPDYLEQEARTAEARAAQRNPKIGGILGKILDMAQRPPR